MMKNKLTIPLIALIGVVLLGAVLYANRSNFSLAEDGKTVYTMEAGKTAQVFEQNGAMLVLDRDGLSAVQTSGQRMYQIPAPQSNPSMSVAGNYMLLYDRGGTSVQACRGDKTVAQLTADREILTAKINAAGYFTVVTKETGYKSNIQVMNQRGEPVYQWKVAESYVVDVAVSSDCKRLAAASLITRDGQVIGKLTVVDLEQEMIVQQTERPDSPLLSIAYTNSGELIAVGETELLGFDRKGALAWNTGYNNRLLTSFCLEQDGNAVLAFAGTRNNGVVEMYNKRGEKTGQYQAESAIKSIHALDGRVAVAQQRDVVLLNYAGKVKAQRTSAKDVRQVVLIRKNLAAVVGASTVELMKL